MKTVLITGTSGHLGGHLARRLADSGMTVRALVRNNEQASYARQQGWQAVQGDLTEPSTLSQALKDVEFVLHSAAYAGKPGPLYETVNVDGTRELAERALDAGVDRFVQISTMSVYGDSLPGTVDEDTPLATNHSQPYCSTKARAEVELGKIRQKGLKVTILRPGMITHWDRSQWGNEMVERMRVGGWPSFLHPDDVMPWSQSRNLAEMSWLALSHEPAANEAFIAVDQNVMIRDFYGPIAAALGKPVIAPDRPPDVSIAKLGKIGLRLGYRAIVSFEETEARLVELASNPQQPTK